MHVPRHTDRCWRTICRSQFSCGFQGSNSGYLIWQQEPFPTELPCSSIPCFPKCYPIKIPNPPSLRAKPLTTTWLDSIAASRSLILSRESGPRLLGSSFQLWEGYLSTREKEEAKTKRSGVKRATWIKRENCYPVNDIPWSLAFLIFFKNWGWVLERWLSQ